MLRTNKQTDKQNALDVLPSPTDIVGVGNKIILADFTNRQKKKQIELNKFSSYLSRLTSLRCYCVQEKRRQLSLIRERQAERDAQRQAFNRYSWRQIEERKDTEWKTMQASVDWMMQRDKGYINYIRGKLKMQDVKMTDQIAARHADCSCATTGTQH